MWSHEESIETTATPAQIWKLFSDVAGWKKWNAGIEKIEIHGPFAKGTTFSMQTPGAEAFTSTLVHVKENECFTDETVIDGTVVLVQHTITRLPSGTIKIIYATQITGPNASELGQIVTGDFADVLKTLKAVAESCWQS